LWDVVHTLKYNTSNDWAAFTLSTTSTIDDAVQPTVTGYKIQIQLVFVLGVSHFSQFAFSIGFWNYSNNSVIFFVFKFIADTLTHVSRYYIAITNIKHLIFIRLHVILYHMSSFYRFCIVTIASLALYFQESPSNITVREKNLVTVSSHRSATSYKNTISSLVTVYRYLDGQSQN
jgi:hypothetical protein